MGMIPVLAKDHCRSGRICTADRLPDVKRVVLEDGSPEPVMLGSENGIPAGWIGLHGVIPRKAISAAAEFDILNVLRADAECVILLEGGIRIGRSSWLAEHPPKIRLLGEPASGDMILLDGKEARPDPAGCLIGLGWDHLGQHSVSCGNVSRTYSIAEGLDHWEPWDAYCWSMGDFNSNDKVKRPTICGPLVRAPSSACSGSRAILVPSSTGLLLGASPGEIVDSDRRADIAAPSGIALPWFSAVWGIPADILRSDKRIARVFFLGDLPLAKSLEPQRLTTAFCNSPRTRRDHANRVAAWCTAILNAGRKGLQIEPPNAEVRALWQAYKRFAKSIWKNLR
jgi:hypothetical protein